MGLKHVFHEWNCWVVVIAEPTRLAPGCGTHSTRLVPPPGAGDEAVVGPGHTRIQKVPRGLVPPRFTLRTQKLVDPTVCQASHHAIPSIGSTTVGIQVWSLAPFSSEMMVSLCQANAWY